MSAVRERSAGPPSTPPRMLRIEYKGQPYDWFNLDEMGDIVRTNDFANTLRENITHYFGVPFEHQAIFDEEGMLFSMTDFSRALRSVRPWLKVYDTRELKPDLKETTIKKLETIQKEVTEAQRQLGVQPTQNGFSPPRAQLDPSVAWADHVKNELGAMSTASQFTAPKLSQPSSFQRGYGDLSSFQASGGYGEVRNYQWNPYQPTNQLSMDQNGARARSASPRYNSLNNTPPSWNMSGMQNMSMGAPIHNMNMNMGSHIPGVMGSNKARTDTPTPPWTSHNAGSTYQPPGSMPSNAGQRMQPSSSQPQLQTSATPYSAGQVAQSSTPQMPPQNSSTSGQSMNQNMNQSMNQNMRNSVHQPPPTSAAAAPGKLTDPPPASARTPRGDFEVVLVKENSSQRFGFANVPSQDGRSLTVSWVDTTGLLQTQWNNHNSQREQVVENDVIVGVNGRSEDVDMMRDQLQAPSVHLIIKKQGRA